MRDCLMDAFHSLHSPHLHLNRLAQRSSKKEEGVREEPQKLVRGGTQGSFPPSNVSWNLRSSSPGSNSLSERELDAPARCSCRHFSLDDALSLCRTRLLFHGRCLYPRDRDEHRVAVKRKVLTDASRGILLLSLPSLSLSFHFLSVSSLFLRPTGWRGNNRQGGSRPFGFSGSLEAGTRCLSHS